MQAIVIRHPGQGPSAWTLVDRADPAPGPGQVLVRVRAASLNYRDLMMARGQYGGPLKDDLIPLADGAGEIVALGPGVAGWQVGDRVCGAYYPRWLAGPMPADDRNPALGSGSVDGVLAQLVALPADGVVRTPAHLSDEEASTLPCAALTAWSALQDPSSRLPPGSTLLVQGTGGVSVFAAQLGLAAGLRVIATTSSQAKAERLRSLGVADVIDYRAQPEWQREVRRLTGGEGVDQVIEVGGAGTLARSFEAVRPGGTVTLIGLLTGVGSQVDPLPVLFRSLRLVGLRVGSVQSFAAMNVALERLALRPVIDQVFPLARAAEALARLESGGHVGKLVVRVD